MIQQKRAIEALRSGVPNRDAVNSLGTSQDNILELFEAQLEKLGSGQRPNGIMIAGGFGSGKSHLLEYLQHVAEQRRYVTSKIVISKETPLHDPAKVFRSAISSARVPHRVGAALTEITESLEFSSQSYNQLLQWVNDPKSGLNERFPATLYLFENLEDQEFVERILSFWSGDNIAIGELKKALKGCGEGSTYNFSKVLARELAIQRFRFAARLIRAAGYAGWILLFDEIELVSGYSLLQRGKSYVEIARWMRGLGSDPLDGIASVLAITDDYEGEVLHDRQDYDDVPNKFRERGEDTMAQLAEAGMKAIGRDSKRLEPLTPDTIERSYQKVRQIHTEAYGWKAPEVRPVSTLASRQMREYVRSWIYAWDLTRLDPSYVPDIETDDVDVIDDEDEDLEAESEPVWENAED